jgi:hypothetical protein
VPDSAAVNLVLRGGLTGDVAAWSALLHGLDGCWATRELAGGSGELQDLRLLRRAARWGRPDLAPTGPPLQTRLRPWTDDVTLAAWLGGWAGD